jgi:erythromycin esterase
LPDAAHTITPHAARRPALRRAGDRSGPGTPSLARKATGAVLAALTRAGRPLRTTEPHGDVSDLRVLGAAFGAAPVVALGEVAHGAHELFTLKHRVFRYLVREKGFRTFVLETSWTSGLRLSAHALHGTGDPRTIMAEEFGGGAWPWDVHEYLHLIRWMRDHNLRHVTSPVQFMANDIAHPRIPAWLSSPGTRTAVHHALPRAACACDLRGISRAASGRPQPHRRPDP